MRVALLNRSAASGDAIGNQIAEKVAFFLDWGADVRVFLECDDGLSPALRPYSQLLDAGKSENGSLRFLSTADLILVEYSQWYEMLDWLPLWAGGTARIVFDYHGVTPPHLWCRHNREGIEKGARQRGLVWCADAAIVHSQFAERELKGATGFPNAWTRHLGYPLDLNRFSPGKPQTDWRERLGLGSVQLLLFVGRLAPNKRVPILIEALARLKDQSPEIHALIVGETADAYAAEAQLCRDRAIALGVADRFHLLGRLTDDELLDAYRSADLFVMPSVHEGFCIPVIEAMACGLPVVAARAAALPETVASAGLTFTPDDADDLARQVKRLLNDREPGNGLEPCMPVSESAQPLTNVRGSLRIAIVAFRFGDDFVGGAESSLRTAAQALNDQGHRVEIFTTCTKSEGIWSNELPEGTSECNGRQVHRFSIDAHDRARHLESVRRILQPGDGIPQEVEQEYLQHSIHSARLMEELHRRAEDFDAVVAGPYLHGLTWDVAREFPERSIVVPCIHDEPFARLRAWPRVYGGVGGIWYHSQEEMRFAEAELGLNHPGGVYIGTWLDTEKSGDASRGRRLVGTDRPYLVYAGRYSDHKNLPTLLEFAQRYSDANPNRFIFVFMGEGHVSIPNALWARDLGFVDESAKRDVLSGASALVQLSRFESLSLVALESWSQGAPVIADRHCAVLAGHLERCGGGQVIDSYSSFADALEDLWKNPDGWQALGRQGQRYVRENYGSRAAYATRLEDSIRDLTRPLVERMRRRGLERAALHSRARWRERWAEVVENILDSPPRPRRDHVEVKPRANSMTVAAGQDTVLVPVRLTNRGTHAVAADGPGRFVIQSRVGEESESTTPLPDLLILGQTLPAAVAVQVPRQLGNYQVTFQVIRDVGTSCQIVPGKGVSILADGDNSAVAESVDNPPNIGVMHLQVHDRLQASGGFGPLLDEIRTALVEASRCQQLPDDYTDVTEGRFAKWKRWIKRKLLGNFKHAYVDVLSRQQSRFNQKILTALTELADYCATLEHAARNQESGVRGQEAGGRSWESGIRSQGSVINPSSHFASGS